MEFYLSLSRKNRKRSTSTSIRGLTVQAEYQDNARYAETSIAFLKVRPRAVYTSRRAEHQEETRRRTAKDWLVDITREEKLKRSDKEKTRRGWQGPLVLLPDSPILSRGVPLRRVLRQYLSSHRLNLREPSVYFTHPFHLLIYLELFSTGLLSLSPRTSLFYALPWKDWQWMWWRNRWGKSWCKKILVWLFYL